MKRHPTLAAARSLLFVPGNRPERFERAARSGADAVILDLEDSVPPGAKSEARTALAAQWQQTLAMGVPLLVRVNAVESPEFARDLAAINSLEGLAAVVVPKAESPESLGQLHHSLAGVPLVPIIESVAGLDAVRVLAATPGVLRLAVGHIDFMADAEMTCDERESELVPLRFAVAMATRALGLAPAIDGVTVETDDESRLREDTLRGLRFGFGGKLCIHPKQVGIVHQTLAPTEEELNWARRVVEVDAGAGGAAVRLEGRMVDLPVVLRARRTLARAAAQS